MWIVHDTLREPQKKIFECNTHEESWHIIDEGASDHKLATILGTKTSIDTGPYPSSLGEAGRSKKQKAQATL